MKTNLNSIYPVFNSRPYTNTCVLKYDIAIWFFSVDDCPENETERTFDVIFLIDGSDSIDQNNFTRVLEWILDTVDGLDPSEKINGKELQITIVQYSEEFRIELDSRIVQNSADEIRSDVMNIPQMREGTHTYSAVQFLNTDVSNFRNESYKILITMTDGRENDARNAEAVRIAKSYFDLMIAIGVGIDIDWGDLLNDISKGVEPITTNNFVSLRIDTIEAILNATRPGNSFVFEVFES